MYETTTGKKNEALGIEHKDNYVSQRAVSVASPKTEKAMTSLIVSIGNGIIHSRVHRRVTWTMFPDIPHVEYQGRTALGLGYRPITSHKAPGLGSKRYKQRETLVLALSQPIWTVRYGSLKNVVFWLIAM